MMIRGTVMILLLASLAAPALAHGPSRQKLTVERKLDATPAEVWAVIGNFQDMSWHPLVAGTDGTGDNTPNEARRTVTLAGDADPPATIVETLNRHDDAKMSYSYRIESVDIDVLPVTNYSSHLTIKDDGGKALVEWRGAFYRGNPLNDPEPQYNDEAALAAVTAVYTAGLDALAEKFGARE